MTEAKDIFLGQEEYHLFRKYPVQNLRKMAIRYRDDCCKVEAELRKVEAELRRAEYLIAELSVVAYPDE